MYFCLAKRPNSLTGTTKAPAVDLLSFNILRGTRTAFLIPKRYDEYPRPFYVEVPPPESNKIKHRLLTKHVDVILSDQTVSNIDHRPNECFTVFDEMFVDV